MLRNNLNSKINKKLFDLRINTRRCNKKCYILLQKNLKKATLKKFFSILTVQQKKTAQHFSKKSLFLLAAKLWITKQFYMLNTIMKKKIRGLLQTMGGGAKINLRIDISNILN